jgi:hypothetical protein
MRSNIVGPRCGATKKALTSGSAAGTEMPVVTTLNFSDQLMTYHAASARSKPKYPSGIWSHIADTQAQLFGATAPSSDN